MNFYKNHYGMIISSVIAIGVSIVMATAAFIVQGNPIELPDLIKNWGTAFLTISLTGMICPLTDWSFALCRKLKLKVESLPHVLVENLVATLVFNTTATLVLSAVNIYGNEAIEAAVLAGQIPSVTSVFIESVMHDWPIMFVISYIAAYFITQLAVRIAKQAVGELITPESPQYQNHEE